MQAIVDKKTNTKVIILVKDGEMLFLSSNFMSMLLYWYPSGGGHLSMNADFAIASLMVAR